MEWPDSIRQNIFFQSSHNPQPDAGVSITESKNVLQSHRIYDEFMGKWSNDQGYTAQSLAGSLTRSLAGSLTSSHGRDCLHRGPVDVSATLRLSGPAMLVYP